MTGKSIDYFWSFIVGGLTAIFAQIVYQLFIAAGFDPFSLAITYMLAVLVFLGAVFAAIEIYQPVEGLAGFGTMSVFSGFAAVITQFSALALDEGKPFWTAMYLGSQGPLILFGIGIPFAFVVALLMKLFHFTPADTSGLTATLLPHVSVYIKAFFLGGLFCLFTQFMFRFTKRSVLFILTGAYCVGIVLSALGWMGLFDAFGQSGMFMLLYGAGEAIRLDMTSLLNGDWIPLIRYVILCCFCFVFASICGIILHQRRQAKEKAKTTVAN